MRRVCIFAALALVFLAWTFPHRRVVEHLVSARLTPLGLTTTFDEVSFSWWPLGYYIEGVDILRAPYSLHLDSLYLSLHWSGFMQFDADGCGGSLRGSLRRERRGDEERPSGTRTLELVFDQIDPARCLGLNGLTVSGTFGGELVLAALGRGDSNSPLGRAAASGHLSLEGHTGRFSGTLPSRPGSTGRPIGEWSFQSATLEAQLRNGQVLLEDANALAERVEWRVTKARLAPSAGSSPLILADLNARPADGSPRAKAIIGLMPKAGERDGWRHYRISGTLDAPQIIGLK